MTMLLLICGLSGTALAGSSCFDSEMYIPSIYKGRTGSSTFVAVPSGTVLAQVNSSGVVAFLEYRDGNAWKDAGAPLSVRADKKIVVSQDVISSAVCLNKPLRIRAVSGTNTCFSETFLFNCLYTTLRAPSYTKTRLNTEYGTGDSSDIFVITDGEPLVLAADAGFNLNDPSVSVSWTCSMKDGLQLSMDDLIGSTYTGKPGEAYGRFGLLFYPSLDFSGAVVTVHADNGNGSVYEHSYEIYVFEKCSVSGGTLTFSQVNMPYLRLNDYSPEAPLYGLRPWESYKSVITGVKLPSCSVSIGDYAFSGMSRLHDLDFSNVDRIGAFAFSDTAFDSVRLGVKTAAVGSGAFHGCSLTDLYVLSSETLIEPYAASLNAKDTTLGSGNTIVYCYKGKAVDALHAYYATGQGSAARTFCDSVPGSYRAEPVGPIDSTGREYYVEYDYTLSGDDVSSFSANAASTAAFTHPGISYTVPLSIDGHRIHTISGFGGDERKFICSEEEHEHDDTCYSAETGDLTCTKEEHTHDDQCYSTERDILGFDNVHGGLQFREIVIDGPFEGVDDTAFYGFSSANHVGEVFVRINADIPFDSFFSVNNELYPDATIYCYTASGEVRRHFNRYKVSFLDDEDPLHGVTGELSYDIDLENAVLTLSGNGSSDNYVNGGSVPFAWAGMDIRKIIIEDGVIGIGDYLFSDMYTVMSIENRSRVLTGVSDTAFEKTGSKSKSASKSCMTYVNNMLYDAVQVANTNILLEKTDVSLELASMEMQLEMALERIAGLESDLESAISAGNADAADDIDAGILAEQHQIEDLKKKIAELENELSGAQFGFTFLSTELACGTEVTASFNAADMTLTLSGTDNGAMPVYDQPTDVPWRCVSEYIEKVLIENSVRAMSGNIFFDMYRLKEVSNHARDQYIVGSAPLFNVIDRYKSGDSADEVYVIIPENIGYTEEVYLSNVADILTGQGLSDVKDLLLGRTLSCTLPQHTHTENCYGGEVACTIVEHRHDDSCYTSAGAPVTVMPGAYYIPRDADAQTIISYLTGSRLSEERYIVPVYALGDSNAMFCDRVPPVSAGYELRALFMEKGVCGDDLYWYIGNDGTLVIEGHGTMYDYDEGTAPWYAKKEYIKNIVIRDGAASIGNFAFADLTEVKTLALPSTVTSLGICALKGMSGITELDISSVTAVHGGAFAQCSGLHVLITGPDHQITDGCLYDAGGMFISYLRDSLYVSVDDKQLYEPSAELVLPAACTAIAPYAFYGVSGVRDITAGSSVVMIGEHAFHNMKDLASVHNDCASQQAVGTDAFLRAGTAVSTEKYVTCYLANSNFANAASEAGYNVVYSDINKIASVTAVYTGDEVSVGRSYDVSRVQVAVVYITGQSKVFYGNSTNITLSSAMVGAIGENTFTAVFDDGYGQRFDAPFTVVGKNGVMGAEFVYTGPSITVNSNISPADVKAVLTYGDGSTATVNGESYYSSQGGPVKFLQVGSSKMSKVGDVDVSVTYRDDDGNAFSGSVKVRVTNVLTKITAEYSGECEVSKGVAGLDPSALHVYLEWADGSSKTVDGTSAMIYIYPDYQLSGDKLIFECTCIDENVDELRAGFSSPYQNNVTEVSFLYIGNPVTKNTNFSLADVQLTIKYAAGPVDRVTGDSVVGLVADHLTVSTGDGTEEVEVSYHVGGAVYSGTIYVPGKIREPLKLIVVKRPKKTVYAAGDVFDREGLHVNCLYNDNSTEDVTDKITVLGGNVMVAGVRYVTLVYEDTLSGNTIRTNMSVNINEFQKEATVSRNFFEQYEITRILFRSKKTQDVAAADAARELLESGGDPDEDDEDDDDGRWIDITPVSDTAVFAGTDSEGNAMRWPEIKAGYGFELKVFTRYHTDRAGQEFSDFLKRDSWDEYFKDERYGIADEVSTKWKYLNDVYPQYTNTANPDVLYLRIQNGHLATEDGDEYRYTELGSSNFIVLEKTNANEFEEVVDEGEWYNSEKIFELPLRDVIGDGHLTRRIYVSPEAANSSLSTTNYGVQIISPAFYGYEPSPVFEGDAFHYVTEDGQTAHRKQWAPGKVDIPSNYLHVCCQFTLKVKPNDDIRTHILQ